jgi:hypothetical protein
MAWQAYHYFCHESSSSSVSATSDPSGLVKPAVCRRQIVVRRAASYPIEIWADLGALGAQARQTNLPLPLFLNRSSRVNNFPIRSSYNQAANEGCSVYDSSGSMCDKCVELDGKIEHYQSLSSRITDQATLDGIKQLVERMRTQKAALHPEQKQ